MADSVLTGDDIDMNGLIAIMEAIYGRRCHVAVESKRDRKLCTCDAVNMKCRGHCEQCCDVPCAHYPDAKKRVRSYPRFRRV